MTVSFNQIPTDRREPVTHIEIDPSLAVVGLQGMPHKTLIMGQMFATGDAAIGELVLITDPEQAAVEFGRGSMLHSMCVQYRLANTSTEMWAIAVADGAGSVAAVKQVQIFTTEGTEPSPAGTFVLYVGGRRIAVGVADGQTPAEVAAALVAKAADDPTIPASLEVDGTVDRHINITARHAGALGSLIDVRANYFVDDRLPTNRTVTMTEPTAGAGVPDITATLTAVAAEWWTEIVTPYVDGANVALLTDFLEARFDAMDARDGMAFAAETGTVSQLSAAGLTRNSPHMTILPHQNSPTPPWEVAAAYAGVAAFQTQIDPARQLKTLDLPGVLAPQVADRFTPDEMDMLLRKGISSTRVTGNDLVLWRCVTTYRVNGAGAADPAFLDLVTMTNLAYIRWAEVNRIKLRFPRHKLADNGTRFGAGQAVVTPEIMRNELIAFYAELEQAGLVENAEFFAERLIVERDAGDPNRLNSLQTPDLINNFRIFAAVLQFRN